ncbi:MAG: transketolase [Desulfovibrio sp.]|nr:MAG: transketolase [Desulfovibrio sp.]
MTSLLSDKPLHERVAYLQEKAKEVRLRIIEMIHKANSGHPGGSLSAADMVTALYFDFLRLDPEKPRWADRDRFILSKGHACPVLYATLAMRGYFPLETLDTLRQFESILQGHPIHKTPGVDMTTGSLGHGLSIGLGMALEGKLRKADFRVFVLLGDGEINEGHVWEAAMAASKFGTDNLVAMVDRNRLQMDGFCDEIMPMGDIGAKFRAFGWETLAMDGHDMRDVVLTIEKALLVKGKPTVIVAETTKGRGVSYMQDVCGWHGRCPNEDEFTCAMDEIRSNACLEK